MPTEERLLKQFVKTQDDAAFAALVAKHQAWVIALAARRLGGDLTLAKDAAQEVFATLARRAGSIDPNTLTRFLHQHACYITANLVRSEKRRKRREAIASELREAASAEAPESGVPAELFTFIHQLPSPDREMVLERFLGNSDLRTLGQKFGLSEDAAQKRVSRALRVLRQQLTSMGIKPPSALVALLGLKHSGATALSSAAVVETSHQGPIRFFTQASNLVIMKKVKIACLAAVIAMLPLAPVLLTRGSKSEQASGVEALENVTTSLPPDPGVTRRVDIPAVVDRTVPVASSETLRLRGEVTRLREELRAIAQRPRELPVVSPAELEVMQPSLEDGEVRQIITFDTVTNAGFHTPEAAMQSYIWAQRQASNPDTFNEAQEHFLGMVYTPPGVNFGGFATNALHDPFHEHKFLKVEAVAYPAPDRAIVYVQGYGNSRRGTRTYFRQENGIWKLDLGLDRR
ncbi:MAG TPA: sigma-70 family RNA polymerase sigma factor [Methylomirabilota bacterium]|nr:sigma-70 family RNA polymerase sigma factor [Methylomirabilota bacterium]